MSLRDFHTSSSGVSSVSVHDEADMMGYGPKGKNIKEDSGKKSMGAVHDGGKKARWNRHTD